MKTTFFFKTQPDTSSTFFFLQSSKSDISRPEQEVNLDVNTHFSCFVMDGENLIELDGKTLGEILFNAHFERNTKPYIKGESLHRWCTLNVRIYWKVQLAFHEHESKAIAKVKFLISTLINRLIKVYILTKLPF